MVPPRGVGVLRLNQKAALPASRPMWEALPRNRVRRIFSPTWADGKGLPGKAPLPYLANCE